MKGRADYECKKCEATIADLPLDCICCPRCGAKRGFRRLYNKVQVSTRGHRAARWIDKRLGPAYEKHDAIKAGAKNFAEGVKEATDRVYEKAPPEVREEIIKQANGMQVHRNVPAAAAMSMIDPAARQDSVNWTYPATKRTVVPIWQK